MAQKQSMISARINTKIKKLADDWCKANGLVMAKFLEDAILDKLEEASDLKELDKLRREPARPLREVLKEIL